MYSHLFYINVYDLAFLATILLTLTFILLLWFTKRVNQVANRFLALALAVTVLWSSRMLAIGLLLTSLLKLCIGLPLQFSLALGPLIFFYVLRVVRPNYKILFKNLLHLSPMLIALGA